MGGAVSGVLGGAQLVSGIVESRSQAKAQAQQTQAQIQNSVDNARLKQVSIMQQQDAANYQLSMGEISRRQQYDNAIYQQTYNQKRDDLDAQVALSTANYNQILASTQAEQNRAKVDASSSAAKTGYQQALQSSAQSVGAVERSALEAANKSRDLISEAANNEGIRAALFAASGLGESASTDQVRSAELMNTLNQYADVLDQTNEGRGLSQAFGAASNRSALAQLNTDLFSNQTALQEINAQNRLTNLQTGFINSNIGTQQSLNNEARNSSLGVLSATNNMNADTDRTNAMLSQAGYQLQNTSNSNTSANQIAAAVASYRPPNQFLSLVGTANDAYNVYKKSAAQSSFLNG